MASFASYIIVLAHFLLLSMIQEESRRLFSLRKCKGGFWDGVQWGLEHSLLQSSILARKIVEATAGTI